jgi:16S rRNA (guanine527-N7)-methyltransferase
MALHVTAHIDAAPPAELTLAATRCFGGRLPLAVRFAELLMTDGVVRGLIGPREAPRIWERHLLNCAVVTELIAPEARVVDVGAGAGLPGVVIAIARPDLSVVLVEPLARRSAFLAEVVDTLDLATTEVVRARAEECVPRRSRPLFDPADVATARAVAPLDRLAAWCLPLVRAGGKVVAVKGDSAAEEVEAHRGAVLRSGGGEPVVRQCGVGVIDPPTTVIEIERIGRPAVGRKGTRKRRR